MKIFGIIIGKVPAVIKSFIGADRSVLFGKWDLKTEGNKIWYSCKVNLWETKK